MTNKQQTAVQWLIEQIMDEKTSVWKKEIEQALKMEREQIEEAWNLGRRDLDYHANCLVYFTDTYQSTK